MKGAKKCTSFSGLSQPVVVNSAVWHWLGDTALRLYLVATRCFRYACPPGLTAEVGAVVYIPSDLTRTDATETFGLRSGGVSLMPVGIVDELALPLVGNLTF